ncbi:terpene synthase family protein [Nocardia sp. NBC_01009]|uniref:terpene synthase family protein n=1 Tax=Nocardia sp. NBC_01009 TaxID=2975996 RepID=UPI00386C7584|nr:terpene synthase family protein [Nocardia sp. NBC_01009]
MGEYTLVVEERLATMRAEYVTLLRAQPVWSLRELFSTSDCDIVDFCRGFAPNPFGESACADVEEFCTRRGIWLEAGGAHYNSMTPYLHPHAVTAERMTIIGIYNAILFWLNDTVGREKFAHLTDAEQRQARVTVERLCDLIETRRAAADPSAVEAATAEFLALADRQADTDWLARFLDSTVDHLRPAIRDQNARARGDLLTVVDYIELRAHVSGMYPAIALCEFGRDEYLRWERVRAAGLEVDLRRLQRLTVEIGALMNDVFSFEKECIWDRADFNLIPVCLLNTPGVGLSDAVHAAAHIVRDRITEFRLVRARIDRVCAHTDPIVAEPVSAHVQDLLGCVQATWVWQLATMRYKGESVFAENRLA